METKAINKAFKFRIYPDSKQQQQIEHTFNVTRFVYNELLAEQQKRYEFEEEHLSTYDARHYATHYLREENSWMQGIDAHAYHYTAEALTSAFKGFFRRLKQGTVPGYPRFKSRYDYNQSYTTQKIKNNIKVDSDNSKVKLPKMDWIEAKIHRPITGQIKKATISRTAGGRYFVAFITDTVAEQLPQNDKEVGIDVGIKHLVTTSEGQHIENAHITQRYEKKLAKQQRLLARKEKGSKNRNKQRIKVARLHEKIANTRKDYLHKLSWQLIKENQAIYAEDLNIAGMVKNRNLAKHITDCGWGELFRQLEYKADWYGRTPFKQRSQWLPTSQMCSTLGCSYRNYNLKLSERAWRCPQCKTLHDRDINAAKNIKTGLNNGK